MDIKTFTISSGPRQIKGLLNLPSGSRKVPFIIACHGLFSSRETDKFKTIANLFPQHGIAVVLFDFGGCGESSGHIADSTASNRLQDLKSVVHYASTYPRLSDKIGLMGSSFGGFVSVLYASKYPINALSLWATPYNLREIKKNLSRQDLEKINEERFFTDADCYDIPSLLTSISTVQVIQCADDEIVPASHPGEIYNRVCDPKELLLIPDGDHSISNPDDRDKALQSCLNWFCHYLQ